MEEFQITQATIECDLGELPAKIQQFIVAAGAVNAGYELRSDPPFQYITVDGEPVATEIDSVLFGRHFGPDFVLLRKTSHSGVWHWFAIRCRRGNLRIEQIFYTSNNREAVLAHAITIQD